RDRSDARRPADAAHRAPVESAARRAHAARPDRGAGHTPARLRNRRRHTRRDARASPVRRLRHVTLTDRGRPTRLQFPAWPDLGEPPTLTAGVTFSVSAHNQLPRYMIRLEMIMHKELGTPAALIFNSPHTQRSLSERNSFATHKLLSPTHPAILQPPGRRVRLATPFPRSRILTNARIVVHPAYVTTRPLIVHCAK